MKTRWIWLIVFLAITASGFLGWRVQREQGEIRTLKTKIAEITSHGETEKREMMLHLEEAEEAKLKAEKEAQEIAEKAVDAHGDSDSDFDKLSTFRKDPAFAAAWRKQQLKELSRLYGEGLAKLNLPADKLAKLKELLLARNESFADAYEVAHKSGLDDTEMTKAGARAKKEVDDEITALVGPEALNQLDEAQQMSTRKLMILSGIGMDMNSAGSPLTNDQVRQLAQTYNEIQDPKKNPIVGSMAEGPVDPQTGLNPLNQAILRRAAQFLVPAQLSILQQSLIEESSQDDGISHTVIHFSSEVAVRRPVATPR